MENPTPKIYENFEMTPAELKARLESEYNDTIDDPFDQF